MSNEDSLFPDGMELPAEPPAWLIILDLGDSALHSIGGYREIKSSTSNRSSITKRRASKLSENTRVAGLGDPDEYGGPIEQFNPNDSILLELAIELLKSWGDGAKQTIDKILNWLETDWDRNVAAGLDPEDPEGEAMLIAREQECEFFTDAIVGHRSELTALLAEGHEQAWKPG